MKRPVVLLALWALIPFVALALLAIAGCRSCRCPNPPAAGSADVYTAPPPPVPDRGY